MVVRAIVLAAGCGSRMGELTRDRPKCLLEVGGRTLLDRQVAALRAGGVRRIGVIAGWRAEGFRPTGLDVLEYRGWDGGTTAGALAVADRWLDRGPAIVTYGDIVYGAATVRRMVQSDADLALCYDPAWITVWQRRFADPLADAGTFRRGADGRLVEIGGRARSLADLDGRFIGLLRITPRAWRILRAARQADERIAALDLTGLLRHVVRDRLLEVDTLPVDGPWWEFDHPADIPLGAHVLRALDTA